jgi:hypothetical protein
MVELPTGDIDERRRGGAGVLGTLFLDASSLSQTGYIRIERAVDDGFVGQIGLREGLPVFCIAESQSGVLQTGIDAYSACEKISGLDDARLSVHSNVDIDLIAELHPYARLLESDVGLGDAPPWWGQGLHAGLNEPPERIGGWARIRSEFEITGESNSEQETSEALDSGSYNNPALSSDSFNPASTNGEPDSESKGALFSSTGDGEQGGIGGGVSKSGISIQQKLGTQRFDFGTAWCIDGSDATTALAIGCGLGMRGSPLLVISRIPPERLRSDHGLHESGVRWLSETPGDPAGIDPHLEVILREIEDFLFANPRAVCVLDGLEFLAALHGFDRMIGFVRDLVDMVASTDDLLIAPVDLLAWSSRERALLTADLVPLNSNDAEAWASRPELMEGHPFLEEDIPPPTSAASANSISSAHPASIPHTGANSDSASQPPFGTTSVGVDAHAGGSHGTSSVAVQEDATSFSMTGLISSWKEEEARSDSAGASGVEEASDDVVTARNSPESASSDAAAEVTNSASKTDSFSASQSQFSEDSTPDAGQTAEAPSFGVHSEQPADSLPDWATAPSPNMAEEPDMFAQVDTVGAESSGEEISDSSMAEVVEDEPIEEPHIKPAPESDSVSLEVDGGVAAYPADEVADDSDEAAAAEYSLRMLAPTIDYKPKGRGGRQPETRSDSELGGSGLFIAAKVAVASANFKPNSPSLSQGGLAVAGEIAIDVADLSTEVATPLPAKATTWAVKNARELSDALPGAKHEEHRRMMSRHSAAVVITDESPNLTANPNATQKSASAQRQTSSIRPFGRIESSEDEEGENIYDRIGALVEAGINVGDLMSLLQINRNAAIQKLEMMEAEL